VSAARRLSMQQTLLLPDCAGISAGQRHRAVASSRLLEFSLIACILYNALCDVAILLSATMGGNLTTDYSSFGLQDKIAIVTGPSQGIGRAIALGLAQAGAHIVLAKHPSGRHEEVRQLQAEIEQIGRKTLLLTTDVSQVADLRAMVKSAHERFGRIDILINNAGWTGTTLALDVTEDEYDRTMAAWLKSVFFACQEAAKVMIPQGGGKIVNIGSNFGVVGFKTRSVYAAAKAGVHHLSRALSLEWAKQGVTVNVVAPC